jgi:ABC-type lipoprotein release transport system permease subunit
VLIIFVVALVIINNALVMATLERVQEIGTLRAVGAQRRFIVGMLVVEPVVIGAIFGALGAGWARLIVAFWARWASRRPTTWSPSSSRGRGYIPRSAPPAW